jgi:hypothetical protein
MLYKITDDLVGFCLDNIRSKPAAPALGDALDKIEQRICGMPHCDKRVKGFDDALSVKEYTISGMCQECQDSFFEGG